MLRYAVLGRGKALDQALYGELIGRFDAHGVDDDTATLVPTVVVLDLDVAAVIAEVRDMTASR